MKLMRAKMKVSRVESYKEHENIAFSAVCKNDGYPEDGTDENNTFAKFTPTAELEMAITNPALFGKIKQGDEFYVDFVRA